jgi:hypothetical protein
MSRHMDFSQHFRRLGLLVSWLIAALTTVVLIGCFGPTEPDSSTQIIMTDTLRNHTNGIELSLPVYEVPQRGPILGHNSLLRQQYAEKYFIPGSGRIAGVIIHVGGVFANPQNTVEISVRGVAVDGLPGVRLGGAAIRYDALNLSGEAQYVAFSSGVAVADSFFVSFDLGDYGHGGFEGDTLGLYACTPGCRDSADFAVYGRNAVQRHNHARIDWRDFYFQNLTPLAVHFALYPVGEGLKP